MFEAVSSAYLVPFDGSFKHVDLPNRPPKDKKAYNLALAECIEKLSELQKILYAADRHAMLLIFQALDAAGKGARSAR